VRVLAGGHLVSD